MKILYVSGAGEHPYCSGPGLIRAFRKLGHEVWAVGMSYGRFGPDFNHEIPNRPHVEWVPYLEVLKDCPWEPDILFNCEPHAYMQGPKPTGLISATYQTDPHRSGVLLQDTLKEGEYNILFLGQPHYFPLFERSAEQVKIILPGFDTGRIQKSLEIPPQCDISFVGPNSISLN